MPDLPPVDLLIRSSGEMRLSNFHLWELAYAELWFTDVLWPDFGEAQLDAAFAAQTPDQALQAAIAQSRPDLWAPLSTNPAAYPDLLGWLASTGNVEVLANLRARGFLTDDAEAAAAGTAGGAGRGMGR